MTNLNATPSGDRIHIVFCGRRNAGKSTLVNALAGQEVSIVSDVPGTTTDPVSKAMELLPLGPVMLTDTAGIDDEGILGEERVRRARRFLETADVAVWVTAERNDVPPPEERDSLYLEFKVACQARHTPILIYHRGDDVDAFRTQLAQMATSEEPSLLADLIHAGDRVVCVCPMDGGAPKGRLILPQQQVIRSLLDAHVPALVIQPTELPQALAWKPTLVITDSQAFRVVAPQVPHEIPLTSFSILFARRKGDLAAFCEGVSAVKSLREGDHVLIAEGCTHRRQCGDIAREKIPALLQKAAGCSLNFAWCTGNDFEVGCSEHVALVVQCGGCMLTRREVLRRIALCREAGIPITNYGVLIAACQGLTVDAKTCLRA